MKNTKSLTINMLKIKNMVKFEIIVIITEGHRGTAHRISDLKRRI